MTVDGVERTKRARAPISHLADGGRRGLGGACLLMICGCQQWFIDDADREVTELIQARQRASIGQTADADIGHETGVIDPGESMYSFVPSPVDSEVPERFRGATRGDARAAEEPEERRAAADAVAEDQNDRRPFPLSEALAYALRHARRYQSEKELLYLSALDLTLERSLWTPRFVQSVLSLDYDNLGQETGFDQTLSAVSNFAIEQRLPYGGEVTARVVNTLIRDLSNSVSTGESGQFIIDARLPLLRGAGPVAYESRYAAERQLVYAVRAFERFRREFLVTVAGDYFNLLSIKAQIESAESQATSLAVDYAREQALADSGRKTQIEADRARVSLLNAENAAVTARERYDTALDFFKIQLGMPTQESIDAVDEASALSDPHVSLAEATETAIHYRLDLLTSRDRVDDARRGVEIARNSLLPQVDLAGAVTLDTDPARFNTARFDVDRSSWQASLNVEIPLERTRERNDYRSAIIGLRRAERDYEEFTDTVRLEVRRAFRRLQQTRSTIDIQREQIRVNDLRVAEARAKLELGLLPSNRDVVDAENDLRDAKNTLAAANSDFQRAVLEFLRDSGTLRVGDDGRWIGHGTGDEDAVTQPPIPIPPPAAPGPGP